jgi:hypothetical protein
MMDTGFDPGMGGYDLGSGGFDTGGDFGFGGENLDYGGGMEMGGEYDFGENLDYGGGMEMGGGYDFGDDLDHGGDSFYGDLSGGTDLRWGDASFENGGYGFVDDGLYDDIGDNFAAGINEFDLGSEGLDLSADAFYSDLGADFNSNGGDLELDSGSIEVDNYVFDVGLGDDFGTFENELGTDRVFEGLDNNFDLENTELDLSGDNYYPGLSEDIELASSALGVGEDTLYTDFDSSFDLSDSSFELENSEFDLDLSGDQIYPEIGDDFEFANLPFDDSFSSQDLPIGDEALSIEPAEFVEQNQLPDLNESLLPDDTINSIPDTPFEKNNFTGESSEDSLLDEDNLNQIPLVDNTGEQSVDLLNDFVVDPSFALGADDIDTGGHFDARGDSASGNDLDTGDGDVSLGDDFDIGGENLSSGGDFDVGNRDLALGNDLDMGDGDVDLNGNFGSSDGNLDADNNLDAGDRDSDPGSDFALGANVDISQKDEIEQADTDVLAYNDEYIEDDLAQQALLDGYLQEKSFPNENSGDVLDVTNRDVFDGKNIIEDGVDYQKDDSEVDIDSNEISEAVIKLDQDELREQMLSHPENGNLARNGKKFREALGETKENYQAHHLITVNEASSGFSILEAAKNVGYDINNANNGISLPSEIDEARRMNLPLHKGSHLSEYTDYVDSLMEYTDAAFQESYANGTPWSDERILKEVQAIENQIRGDLLRADVKLQSKDPR